MGRLGDLQPVQHRGEEHAVFGYFNALGRRADDIDAVVLQTQCEIERCLAAELRDRAPARFPFVNVQHVFERERFEIEPVAGVVVRRNRLRIRVDHQRFKTVLLERECGVDATVIELDALADAVRATAENHDLAFVGTPDFIVAPVVGRIVIRGVGLELGRASIDQPVTGNDAQPFAFGANLILRAAGQMSKLSVGETEGFGFG